MRNKGKSIISFPDDFCVVDIETTGLDYSCSIIEISSLKVSNGVIVDSFSKLIRPDSFFTNGSKRIYIDSFISDLTGITNDMLDEADSISEVLPEFDLFIGDNVIVGHNIASFDSNFIYDAYKKNLGKIFSNNYIDTMRISRWLLPELDHHRLSDIGKHFSVDTNSMHRGLTDCQITFACFSKLKELAIEKYGDLEAFYSHIKRKRSKTKYALRAKDITSTTNEFDISNPIYGSICVFTGTLEKMTRREAMQIVKDLGGENKDSITQKTNFLILGNNDFCKSIKDGKSSKQKKAEKLKSEGYDIEIISESVFYDMAGIQ